MSGAPGSAERPGRSWHRGAAAERKMAVTPQEARKFWQRQGRRCGWADALEEEADADDAREPETTGRADEVDILKTQLEELRARVQALEAAVQAATSSHQASQDRLVVAAVAVRTDVRDAAAADHCKSTKEESYVQNLPTAALDDVPSVESDSESRPAEVARDASREAVPEEIESEHSERKPSIVEPPRAGPTTASSDDAYMEDMAGSERPSEEGDYEHEASVAEEYEPMDTGAASSNAWGNPYVDQDAVLAMAPAAVAPAALRTIVEEQPGSDQTEAEAFQPTRGSRGNQRRVARAAAFPISHVEAVKRCRLSDASIREFENVIQEHIESARMHAELGDTESAEFFLSLTETPKEHIAIEKQLRRDEAALARGRRSLLL